MRRFAVIPTGNRPEEYKLVIDWCRKHDVLPITIATSEEANKYAEGIHIRDDGLNISHWWNLGLEFISKAQIKEDHVIAILNDDVTLPDKWFEVIEQAISNNHWSGASGKRGNRNLYNKISGYAFALNGKDGIRADESFVWYYGDDDIQHQCEKLNGFGLLNNLPVKNKYAFTSEERFSKQIKKDRITYEKKYGIAS